MKNIFLNILSFGTIFSCALSLSAVNPVTSVIFLILVFINAAGYLIVLGVGFIGISYILLYVGAITVLFLFVVMMLNIKLSDITDTIPTFFLNLALAFIVIISLMYELNFLVPFTIKDVSILTSLMEISHLLFNPYYIPLNVDYDFNNTNFNADTAISNFLQIQVIGHGLYTYGAALLILCSLILLLAMVAPIFISKRSKF
uniref:NADH-ubiquinone oxidoreductase chain 6 n=1 Tax=Phlebopus portentosus TaxID=80661 RepID=A0A481ZLY4_9AGAM|nr:NADH dehydrogenase subunit 6 [Phlebopus portentosus]